MIYLQFDERYGGYHHTDSDPAHPTKTAVMDNNNNTNTNKSKNRRSCLICYNFTNNKKNKNDDLINEKLLNSMADIASDNPNNPNNPNSLEIIDTEQEKSACSR